jgi:non-ribosomal peptide synthetase component F/acyl carrier protein
MRHNRDYYDKLAIAANQKQKERDYWLDNLSGEFPRSQFPFDIKNNDVKPQDSELDLQTITIDLGEETGKGLLKLAAGSDARLHMVLTAAVTHLLARYSGNDDIIIGTPVFQQQEASEGQLLNSVIPIRSLLSKNSSFKDLLKQIRTVVKDGAIHQSFPMEILVEKLNLQWDNRDFPLFDVMVVLENIQYNGYLDHVSPHMVFSFSKSGENIEGRLLFDPGSYSKMFASQVAGHFLSLLSNTLTDLDAPLVSVPLLDEMDLNHLVVDFNNTEVEYPREKTIVQWFQECVEENPGTIAVTYAGKQLTYLQLNERANQLAHLLRDRGVAIGNVVAVLLDRSIDLVVTILAVLKAGAAYLPIDPAYPELRILKILETSGVSLLLTELGVIHPISFTALQNQSNEDNLELVPFLSPKRPQIRDFDSLPFPDRTLVDYSKYHCHIGIAPVKRSVSMQTTRGCPYSCLYCHKIWPKSHISRSDENVYEEIRINYEAGIRDFVFIDDVFNLDKKKSGKLLENIIRDNLDVRLYYPNGLRADVLDKNFIDLMVEAGAVDICVALESASPRIQKLIKKNLNLDRFRENVQHIAKNYPHVLLEMEMMHGFPTETKEEALMTFDFLKSIKWVHFPNLHILKIFPGTDMYRLALDNGISKSAIESSTNFAYHELPNTLPFPKHFSRQLQAQLLEEYFLSKERLLALIPHQLKTISQEELIKKYDSYLPMDIKSLDDIRELGGISHDEWRTMEIRPKDDTSSFDFNRRVAASFPIVQPVASAFRIMMLDLSLFFTHETDSKLYDVTEEPLGMIYLLSYLRQQLGETVNGKIAKSRVDFDNYEGLKHMLCEFKPHLIGIRSLSYYREFFHRAVALIKQWLPDTPIVSGGPYATSDYPILLRDPNIDLVVVGEGEHTFLELVQQMKANDNRLPGLETLQILPGLAFIQPQQREGLKRDQRQVLIPAMLADEIATLPVSNLEPQLKPDDLLYLISTSGSTGTPKSVMMAHENLVNLIHFQHSQTKIDFDQVLQFASIAFDVSFQEIFTTLLAGGTIHLLSPEVRSNIPLLLEFINDNQIKTLFLPPAFLKFIFDEEEYVAQFPQCVSDIITAGEQLVVTPRMRDYFSSQGITLHNHYGPAETHVVTVHTMTPGDDLPALPPIGKPIANTGVYILDRYDNIQPIGVAGELVITGDAVGQGYLNVKEEKNNPESVGIEPHKKNNAETSNQSFFGTSSGAPVTDGFYSDPRGGEKTAPGRRRLYRTGDLACWLADGNIQFLGRADYQVQVRGFRIELEEIRKQLEALEIIKDAVVVDRRTDAGDVYLCAYIVPLSESLEFEAGEIREHLAQVLPDYMVPSHYIRLEALPLNSSGKVDRNALPVPSSHGIGDIVQGNGPRDEMEERIVELWQEILEVPVTIDDNFFEMGGHSLKGTVLISRIHKEFLIKLQLMDLFKFPTVRQLSDHLKESGVSVEGHLFQSLAPAPIQDFYPLSASQKRLYILQQMDKQATTYNMLMIFTITGELDFQRLERAFQALIQRHESLRTSFVTNQGQAVQKIHDHVEASIDMNIKQVETFLRPFDLTAAPLIRIALKPLEGGESILMLDMHHIISDAVTLEIVFNDFMALYEQQQLAPLPFQYKDYTHWQNQLIQSGGLQKYEQFWLERFRGDLPRLAMPSDFPRPKTRKAEGANSNRALSVELSRSVRELGTETHTTLYQLLMAVYIILLHKYSGQTDIIIGSPVSGRQHADLHAIAGVFVNMVAIRTRPHEAKSFKEFLEEVQHAALAAHENQEYPFDDLVHKLGITVHQGENPIFDVGFLFNDLNVKKSQDSSLTIRPYNTVHKTSRFDMLMGSGEVDGCIHMGLEYSTQLFKSTSIDTMLEHYEDILKQVTKEPGILLADISIHDNLQTIQAQQPEITFGF